MSQLDAIHLAAQVRTRLSDFAGSESFVRDANLKRICLELWRGSQEAGGMVSDLWVEGAFPAEDSSDTLDSLTAAGLFDSALRDQLDRRNVVPGSRLLYSHQSTAIRTARASADTLRPAIVVSAGTGSGKTESFLLPVLNDCFSNPRLPGEMGVRCIIIYPMNALVNDQVDRLYNWMSEQPGMPRVTLFHFTSDTPEDYRSAVQEGLLPHDPCRFLTRQQARGLETASGQAQQSGPVPDVLITNYSMLEYMLCRPQDTPFFGSALRSLVLDEAHLYTGTLATEIMMLIRRLLERCERTPDQVMQIATSATIGGGAGVLSPYAASLFSKGAASVTVVQGRDRELRFEAPEPPYVPVSIAGVADIVLASPTIEVVDGETRLRTDSALCDTLALSLQGIVSQARVMAARQACGDVPARLLSGVLPYAPLIQKAAQILWDARQQSSPAPDADVPRVSTIRLKALAAQLWGIDDETSERATIALLRLGATARERVDAYPVLPHRLHLLVRPADPLVICLNDTCSGPSTHRLDGLLGCISAGTHAMCPYCSKPVLSLVRCDGCGDWALAAGTKNHHLRPISGNLRSESRTIFTLAQCAKAQRTLLNAAPVLTISRQNAEITGAGAAGLTLYRVSHCPCCDRQDEWKQFGTGMSFTLSLLAETTLAELPPLPATNSSWLPAEGRRLLIFSDSRREAANLGPRLADQHQGQMIRAAITRTLQQMTGEGDPAVVAVYQQQIAQYQTLLNGTSLPGPNPPKLSPGAI